MTDLRTYTVAMIPDKTETIGQMETAYGLIQKTYNRMGTGFGLMTYETLCDCLEELDIARENLAAASENVLESATKEATEGGA